ncbi:hypothetical protein CDEST_02811 [Colletotrichum destructivum]|uniref:Uncharacterized protein n=1 Tax=Colletotrichum destructivum TaxID=34406 RepID=A0AAX4I3B2_9PEZI|nr:hypothetical protein CDEST_02811 [Colletotrichum destructivum]
MTSTKEGQESAKNTPPAGHHPSTAAASTPSPFEVRKQSTTAPRPYRPSDILIFPPSPLAADITIVRMAREAAFLPSPRLRHNIPQQRQLSIRPKPSPLAAAQKRPRILLSTKNFKWVKTCDALWVKVPAASKKQRVVLKMKGKKVRTPKV